jgi:hypothetical protein
MNSDEPVSRYLHIGGVVAVGFNPNCQYLLVISHSGRGVFSTVTWDRVARNYDLAYPKNGYGIGIGPIEGLRIPVFVMDFVTGQMQLESPDGRLRLDCESSEIGISSV